jgi:hypothetical protein
VAPTDLGRQVAKAALDITDYDQAVLDMAFIRALLEAVNNVPDSALVVAMIASDKDNMAMTEKGTELRIELEDLLTRNASTTAVTSGGDFAEIVQKRLFSNPPPPDITNLTADHYSDTVTPAWQNRVFKRLDRPNREQFRGQVARTYPFHPDLIALAENEWATHAGFQKVRSMINVFALAVYEQTRRGQSGEWAPPLIDSGDLPLGHPPLRDALLNSGLVEDQKTAANLREVATIDIADPHNPDRGTAHRMDTNRDASWSWASHNPRAAERMATAMFVRSLNPRTGGARGATEAEILAASYIPAGGYEVGDAETVFGELVESDQGMASVDYIPGQGRRMPKRWFFETRNTVEMLTRAEKASIPDADRDKAITDRAFAIAGKSRHPFDKVLLVEGPPVPREGTSFEGSRQVLKEELVDTRETRLAILDSRWFSLLNGDDSATREALRSGFGLGERPLANEWASSLVFACANTDLRARARGIAAQWLACERVSKLPSILADSDMQEKAKANAREALRELDKRVRSCYQHIAYLAPTGDHHRRVGFVRMGKDTRTALNAADVWEALSTKEKTFLSGRFGQQALLHNLKDNDYGRPLREIRDAWWSDPRKPLLPDGERELQRVVYEAVTEGKANLMGDSGERHRVIHVDDINLNLASVRLHHPSRPDEMSCPTCSRPASQCAGHAEPPCRKCGQSPCRCSPHPPSRTGWQVNLDMSTAIDAEEGNEDLEIMLRHLANLIEEGKVGHVNLMIQMVISDQNDVDAIGITARDAGSNVNIRDI